MTEYYDEAYFCIYKDPVIWAQNCGEHAQPFDLGGVMLQPTPTILIPSTPPIPEPATSLMMLVGLAFFALVLWIKPRK
jgi:hypothetical protein